jgi:hypothetical protein
MNKAKEEKQNLDIETLERNSNGHQGRMGAIYPSNHLFVHLPGQGAGSLG